MDLFCQKQIFDENNLIILAFALYFVTSPHLYSLGLNDMHIQIM
jgi:hypothetical protein